MLSPGRSPDGGEPDLAAALVEATLADIVRGLGPAHGPLHALTRTVAGPVARRFAAVLQAMDAAIAARGLAGGAAFLLERFSGPVRFEGLDAVPPTGSLLAVANHPGTVDTPLLWQALAARDDLRVVALDRPVLKALPALAARLLYVPDEVADRTRLVRLAADHLRAGGALLTFPAGTVEPDPALRPTDALTSLASWSRSPELFARLAPVTVLPIAVSGVISPHALTLPLARFRRTTDARELAAATWQVLRHDTSIRPVVRIGAAIEGGRGLTATLAARMAGLLSD